MSQRTFTYFSTQKCTKKEKTLYQQNAENAKIYIYMILLNFFAFIIITITKNNKSTLPGHLIVIPIITIVLMIAQISSLTQSSGESEAEHHSREFQSELIAAERTCSLFILLSQKKRRDAEEGRLCLIWGSASYKGHLKRAYYTLQRQGLSQWEGSSRCHLDMRPSFAGIWRTGRMYLPFIPGTVPEGMSSSWESPGGDKTSGKDDFGV